MRSDTFIKSKFTPIYSLMALLTIAFIFISNSSNPPNGYTGAPGDSLCTACHAPGSPPQNGMVTISGLPAMITPNTTYTLTVTSENPNGLAVKAGFQMVVLNANNMNAGAMSNNSPNTAIQTSGGRTYFEHSPSANYPASNTISWTVDWTAPAGGTTITAYASNNVANGNGLTSGDLIVTTNVSGQMEAGDPLSADITNFEDVSCNGGNDGSATVTASDGIPPYSYLWSNGAMTATANNLSAGAYTVTVTDNTPSTATASVVINEPPPINLEITNQTNVECPGEATGSATVSASGGTGQFSYAWSNGGFGPMQSNLEAGVYTVTATDDNGCDESIMVFITEPDPIELIVAEVTNVDCNGNATGEISVEADGGTAPYAYDWSNGASGQDLFNLEAGFYEVTVTDFIGCTAFFNFEVTEPPLLTLMVTDETDVSCNGGNDGSATVNAQGGMPSYFYSWSNGGSGATQNNLAAGMYTVTVEDQNFCTATVNVVIGEPSLLTLTVESTTNIDCNGNQTGSATVSAAGGTPAYTYNWSNGGNGDTQNNLGAGMYGVTVTDDNGCTNTVSITLTEPDVLIANASATPESSAGANDGTATANPTGGTPDYSYVWSNSATTQMITDLAPGNYTVTVTDANGCTSMETVTVTSGGCAISADIISTNISCNGAADGTAAVVVDGGSPPFSFAWSNGSTDSLIMDLGPGPYTVTVTDAVDCEVTANVTITQPMALTVMTSATHETAAGADDGTATANPNGGTPPYSYMWSNGGDTQTITDLAPGSYQATVTDMNGCTASGSATVNPFDCPPATITSEVNDVLCNGGNDGSIIITATSGLESPLTFEWSTGSMMADSLTVLEAGSYSVTITDANGCATSASFEITEPEPLAMMVDSVLEATDTEGGAIFITISGGIPPYSYSWELEGEVVSTAEDPADLAVGSYSATIMDANGCTIESGEIIVDMDLAFNDPVLNRALSIYPVPAGNVLHISLKDYPSGEAQWILFNIMGKRISEGKMNLQSGSSKQLDVSRLDGGLYLLGLRLGEATVTKRILVQR